MAFMVLQMRRLTWESVIGGWSRLVTIEPSCGDSGCFISLGDKELLGRNFRPKGNYDTFAFLLNKGCG